ncbi:MAG: glycosyltransferase [Chlorobium sp.]|nr:glycosyltransferase [Chlorobium sp.]
MKVLHLISSLGYGGAERLVATLIPCLKEQGVEGVVVSMGSEMPLRGELDAANIPVYCLSHEGTIYSIMGLARSLGKLRDILKKENPDIVHSHLYLPDILSRVGTPLCFRLVSTLHNMDTWWNETGRVRSVGKTWLDRLSGHLRQVRYISVSEGIREKAGVALAIKDNENRVIHNGINLSKFEVKKPSNSENKILIQVGRFYPQKGHFTSLKALAIISEHFPHVRLVLIGDGPLRDALIIEAKRLGVFEMITFMGLRDDIPEQLRQADIYWMPSEWEGLPIACVEAMACGLPVVVSSVGGLPELVIDRQTGYLVEKGAHESLAQRTIELLANDSLATEFGMNGRKRVENMFSINATAHEYVRAYEDILRGVW